MCDSPTIERILAVWHSQMTNPGRPNIELDTALSIPIVLGCSDGRPYIMLLTENKPQPLQSMQAIEVRITDRRPSPIGENWSLTLTLQDPKLIYTFAELCLSFADRIRDASSAEVALKQVYTSIDQWKRLLQASSSLISWTTITGVFAELVAALSIAKITHNSIDVVLQHWTGPRSAPQDFTFPEMGKAWEVKAVHSTTKQIAISSPTQLDTSSYAIGLVTVDVQEVIDAHERAMNIADVMDIIRGYSRSILDVSLILNALQHFGINPYSDDVRKAYYLIGAVRMYEVRDDFPRIVESMVPHGVVNLKYSISCNDIESYLVHIDENPLHME